MWHPTTDELHREAHEFLSRSGPQQQRGYYYSAQDLNEARMEQALQDELELERLGKAAEDEQQRQQIDGNSGGPPEVAESPEDIDQSQQRIVQLTGPVMVLRPTEEETFHVRPHEQPPPQPETASQPTSSSPRPPPNARPTPSRSASGSVQSPPNLRRQNTSMAEVDLSKVKDERLREVFDPNSSVGMHELAGWSDEELDNLVENFQPEYLPGLIRKGMKTEGAHQASSLCWEGLTYTNNKDEKLLRHVSGYLHPGQIVGILAGPDGGATPLLNVLAGREKDSAWTGSVLYNGQQRSEEYKRVTGYVDKNDTHIGLLSVYETLYFSARLRLPQALPDKLVRLRVKIVMKLLGLSHVAETYIGDASVRGVSGGEKRRVSFGVEMVAGRECLLADLPTNGLDSASAYSLMRTMRFTCKGGLSMMASVVQPSTELFQLFHNVLVLSKGAVLYFGPPSRAETFFADAGFRRPASKSVPQFLEELSAAPERFYIHRFNTELKQRGEGDMDVNKGEKNEDKPLGELGAGADKGGDNSGQSERKENPGDWRGEERASSPKQALIPSPRDARTQQQQQQRQRSELDMQSRGRAEGEEGSADEADKVPRGPNNVDNARVQCWNVLVDHYESSKFKRNVRSQIEEDKEGDRQFGSGAINSNLQHQQSQQQQQQQSSGSYDKQLTSVPTAVAAGAVAGSAASYQRGQQSGHVKYQPKAAGDNGKDGRDGFFERKDHGIFNFWYRRYNSSLGRQLYENIKRMSLVFLRNVGLWRNTWLRAIFIGLVLGSLFYNLNASETDIRNRVGLIFFIALYVGFGGVQLFPILSAQRPVFYKQQQAGYFQGLTYYFSLQLVQLPILILETTLLLVPIWGLSNLSGGDFSSNQFWFAWITLTITSLIGRAWVMVLLAVSPIEAMANVLLVMTNILFVTLCGFLIPKDEIEAGWHWFWYISYISYTFRALAINDIEPLYNPCVVGSPGCPYNSGQDALQSLFDIDGTYNKWKDFGRLCGIFIAFSCGAAIAYNVISWDKPDTPEAPDWGDVGADGAEQQQALMAADGKPVPPKPVDGTKQPPLHKRKSKIVRSMENLTVSAQMANAEPGDAPAANSQGTGNGEGRSRPERPDDEGRTNNESGDQGEGGKGPDGKILATKPMRPRDDSIPMPIPAAALLVVKAKKSNSSPALLQKEEMEAAAEKKKEEEQKQRADHGQKQGRQQGKSAMGGNTESGHPSAPQLQRAASHDFGFEIEGKQTEALVSGVKSYMQWRDLSYTVTLDNGQQRKLLNKTFGYVRPGIMCALMGASGAGKSTLLDVLAGKKTSGNIEGEMLVNGRPKDETFTRIAAYCEQNDAHNPMSTVREAIAFSGRMRLPQKVSNAELQMKVKNVLEVLGLAHLADERIGSPGMGGVSPEVRKKVTIGVELIAEPSILFLDEPTTGLDSAGAYAVMSAVHTLSKHMAVVCTVHQPSMELTKMFDDIILMKDGGEIVYFGAMSGLVTYFAESGLGECPPGKNPVDFALEQLRRANELNRKGPKLREEDKEKQQREKEEKNGGLIKRLSRQFSRKSDNAEPERQGDENPKADADASNESKRDTRDDHDIDVEAQNARTKQKRQDEKAARGEALQSSSSPKGDKGDKQGEDDDGKGGKKGSQSNDISPEAAARLSSLFTESNFYEGIKKTLDKGVMPEDEKAAYRPPDMESTHANTATQITWLTHRFFTNVWRNKFGLAIRFFLILVFQFFVGTIFLRLGYNQAWAQQRLGVMFLVLINVMFSTNAFLPEIYFNRPIYFRESTANMYSAFSYFVARYAGDAPYVVAECFLYSLLYFWVGMNPYDHNRGYGYWLWLLLALRWTGIALTHLFGTAIAAPDFAATLLITFYQVMLAFTGFLIPGPSIPSWWIWLYDISFIRYALDTAVYFNFIHETFSCDGNTVPVYVNTYTAGCNYATGDAQIAAAAGRPTSYADGPVIYKCQIACAYDIFQQNGIDWRTGTVVRQFAILHCFAIFFFVCAFLALRFINHVKR